MPQPPGGQHRRHAGVATDRHDDLRLQPAEQLDRRPAGPPQLRHHRRVAPDVGPRQLALQPDDVEERVRERRRRQQPGLDAARRPDVVDLARLAPAVDERLGDGQRRQHVPGRAAPGDDGERQWPSRGAAGDVEQQAGGGHRHEQRRAAGGEERQRQAGDRHQAGDAAEVDDGLHAEPRRDAAGEQHAEAVGRRRGRSGCRTTRAA